MHYRGNKFGIGSAGDAISLLFGNFFLILLRTCKQKDMNDIIRRQ